MFGRIVNIQAILLNVSFGVSLHSASLKVSSLLRDTSPDTTDRFAPFVYDVWKNPETLAIVSQIAGIDLVTEMDFEIGHINISVKSEKQKDEELRAYAEKTQAEADEGIGGCPWEDDKPIVDWHTDSYPFVCVTMLSDCTNMIGGETALRTGTGDILKVRGPQMVHTSKPILRQRPY